MNAKHPSSNRLIIVCGLSFAGKSTLGSAICAEFGYPQVDVDQTKADLYGPGIDDEDLDPEQWVYPRNQFVPMIILDTEMSPILVLGKSLILTS